MQIFHVNPVKMVSISLWNVTGVLQSPNGITLELDKPE